MATVRVREGVQSTTFDYETQTWITLTAGMKFDDHDEFVKANRWAFEADTDADKRGRGARRTTAVNVEQASADPGELRNR